MTEVCKEEFGTAVGPVEKWTLRSGSVCVEIISLGCVIKSITTEDRSGQSADLVLGYDDLEGKFYQLIKERFIIVHTGILDWHVD